MREILAPALCGYRGNNTKESCYGRLYNGEKNDMQLKEGNMKYFQREAKFLSE